MKRIYSLIAIMSFALIQAQTTTVTNLVIKNQVEDNTSNRTLVINPSNGKVGYTISSGGGGSQNLQQTLDNGNEALDQGITFKLTDQPHATNYMDANQVSLSDTTGGVLIRPDRLMFYQPNIDNPVNMHLNATLKSSPATSNDPILSNYFLPDKPTGDYNLATLDDITFQQAYNNGGSGFVSGDLEGTYIAYNFSDFGLQMLKENNDNIEITPEYIGFSNLTGKIQRIKPSTDSATTEFILPEKTSGSYEFATIDDINLQKTLEGGSTAIGQSILIKQTEGSTGLSYMDHQFFQVLSDTNTGLQMGGTDDDLGIFYSKGGTTSSNVLSFAGRTELGIANFIFPNKVEGDHILATTNDIPPVHTDSTTTALSSSDLNTEYPTAIIGTQVHALDITGTPLIYIKTATGWVGVGVNIIP